ncbi:MAG: thermonuclease family protein [Candidatus Moraniibacteriota bacterium]
MTRKQSIFFIIVLFVGINIFVIFFFQNISVGKTSFPLNIWNGNIFGQGNKNESETFLVKKVVDGDTIELDNGEKVRYVGVNTPESVDPRRKVECFGKEASAYNKDLVEGKKVRLEKDISDRDKYGRLLRFVYLEDGTFVNELLVREGYAFVSTYPPDVSKQDIFRRAESDARNAQLGLWNKETCDGKK